MKVENLKNKKILILGFGKEGKDTLNFLSKVFPDKTFGVADKDKNCKLKIENLKLKKVKLHFGENYLEALKDYDLIIKSPGIPIHLPEIEEAFREGKITSQTEIFFENYKGKIVGITGTKGKSTTASLIYKILKEGKLNVKFGGNIGKPVLNYLISSKENEVFVYELSSHQLYNLKISPHIAVFLNIYPEHLDYYKDFNEYLMAKANITLWQRRNDFLIYNFKDKNLRKIANKSKAKKIPIKDYSKVLKQIGIKKLPFYGKFYGLNIACAIEVGKIFGINKEKMKKVIENFKPLPHRLEYVGKFKGIDFFNDSLSTIPQTTIAALDSLGEKVQTLILGGYNRRLSFKGLAKEIIKKKIKNLILFPDTGKIIWDEILKETKNKPRFENVFFIDNMKDAVKASFKVTQKNKICLLSPASPSFGIFKNYKERGDLFKKYIRIYGRNKRTKN
jgi:UDP-N-acetylmuramoylalanine--D-glutamate ligase